MSNYLDMLHDCSELRKFITENPELPIVVLVGDETNTGDYQYVYCTQVKCTIGEVLDCELPIGDGKAFYDRDDFREELATSFVICLTRNLNMNWRSMSLTGKRLSWSGSIIERAVKNE